MDGEPQEKRSERATTVALVAAAAGLLWSLFWLFESFGPLSSIWERSCRR